MQKELYFKTMENESQKMNFPIFLKSFINEKKKKPEMPQREEYE